MTSPNTRPLLFYNVVVIYLNEYIYVSYDMLIKIGPLFPQWCVHLVSDKHAITTTGTTTFLTQD